MTKEDRQALVQAEIEAGRRSPIVPIPVVDTATRVFLFSQLVAQLDACDEQALVTFIKAGFTPELLDRLRNLSVGDAVRFASGQCGLSIHVDCDALRSQLGRVERAREDKAVYEHFIRAGASPRLIARLFAVSHTDVRRARKLLAPEVCLGGRPRLPDDDMRTEIRARWQALGKETSEKHRYWLLSQTFPELPIVSLESILDADDDEPHQISARASVRGWTGQAQQRTNLTP